ncbi:hypothetical protein HELRODRAFT_164019 [Helobdella robusta]|uniref:Uncharacterized protein n=1 Tax=Helobdella robusta TaxID=6412 RepID=T1EUS1_HELRO|nr:hypothetical protein HELRODRAFT_164019 [Helobdella robusta]ESN94220.1 hypothetical protein HELRODRAFT_164019 [Helobdella robusta]
MTTSCINMSDDYEKTMTAEVLLLSGANVPVSQHLDETALDTFIKALRDSELKQSLLLSDKRKLKDAVAHSLTVESAKQASKSDVRLRQVHEECSCQKITTAEIARQDGAKEEKMILYHDRPLLTKGRKTNKSQLCGAESLQCFYVLADQTTESVFKQLRSADLTRPHGACVHVDRIKIVGAFVKCTTVLPLLDTTFN